MFDNTAIKWFGDAVDADTYTISILSAVNHNLSISIHIQTLSLLLIGNPEYSIKHIPINAVWNFIT